MSINSLLKKEHVEKNHMLFSVRAPSGARF